MRKQHTKIKGVEDNTRQDGTGDPLGTVRYTEIWPLENATDKVLWYFEIQTKHLILTKTEVSVMINEKKREKNLVFQRFW